MIALFSPSKPDDNWTRLCNVVMKSIPSESISIFQTLESFYDRARQGRTDISAAIVHISNMQDIHKLQALRDLISDMRIIMILPDNNEETLRIGHSFYPRYISFADSTFEDVTAVLQKIILNTRKEGNPNKIENCSASEAQIPEAI